jgi:SSS family solute:Na+ symporter
MARLVLELGGLSPAGWTGRLAAMNFLHFAILLFLLCAAVLVAVSLATRPPDAARVEPLTINAKGAAAPAAPARDIALSAALVGLVIAAWLYFS